MVLVMSLGGAAWLFGRRGQLYLLFPLVCIWTYALISGLGPPAQRAAIMGTTYLAALAIGRPRSVLPSLAFGAAVMTGVRPSLLNQVDFQLSFAAMAGIALALSYQTRVAEVVTSRWPGIRQRPWLNYGLNWLTLALIASLVATLATFPLVAFKFDRIPLLGLPLTLLSLPVLPVILLGSFLTALAAFIHPLFGQVLGWLTWIPLTYQLGLVSAAPAPVVSGSWVNGPLVWAWYIGLGIILLLNGSRVYFRGLGARVHTLWSGRHHGGLRLPKPSGVVVSCLGLALILGVAGTVWWLEAFHGPDGKLHLYFFDVGQGDSALIVTPTGRQVLIDGGPDHESATRALGGPMPFWDRSLDLVVLTHQDSDHSRGLLNVLENYRVGAVLQGVEDKDDALYGQWRAALDRQKLQVVPVHAGYRVVLEDGITIEVLNPPPIPFAGTSSQDNDNGLVLRLVHQEVSFLLAADIEAPAEVYLVKAGYNLRSTVLKVPHHGSKTSSTEEFLSKVKPSQAVISAGAGNRFGHPHPEVVARLEQVLGSVSLYETARHGNVEFISDGHRWWVQTQR